jgi:hypothetical protein
VDDADHVRLERQAADVGHHLTSGRGDTRLHVFDGGLDQRVALVGVGVAAAHRCGRVLLDGRRRGEAEAVRVNDRGLYRRRSRLGCRCDGHGRRPSTWRGFRSGLRAGAGDGCVPSGGAGVVGAGAGAGGAGAERAARAFDASALAFVIFSCACEANAASATRPATANEICVPTKPSSPTSAKQIAVVIQSTPGAGAPRKNRQRPHPEAPRRTTRCRENRRRRRPGRKRAACQGWRPRRTPAGTQTPAGLADGF